MTRGISRQQMARRVASELKPGQVVNLGPGLPALVGAHLPPARGVVLHAESGLLGYSSAPGSEPRPPDLVDSGGEAVALAPGAAVLDQASVFGVVRGGYLDVAVLEAQQVSRHGDLMDRTGSFAAPPAELLAGARRVVVIMEHTDETGAPRVVQECRLPTSGRAHLVVTDLAVMEVTGEGLLVKELAPGWRLDQVRALTGASLVPSPGIREMRFEPTPAVPAGKVYPSAAHAVADIPDGAVVMLDGFGGPGGMAHYLILALKDQGATGLTIISNTAGIARVSSFGTPPGFRAIDHSVLVDNGQIRKSVASFPVSPSPSRPSPFELAYKAGEAELELVPQGTLAERIRAGGFGIAAFYTPTGAGTLIAEGKETRTIDGREYVLEHALRADYALLRAHKADTMGNLVYRGTSRNFNAVMAPAARVTVVEVDEIVEPGELDPDAVVTPGVFVQRIVRRPPGFFPYERVG